MARTSPLSRGRRIAIWSLIVLASLLAIVAILATWVNRQILDNGSFQTTSTHLDPGSRDPERALDLPGQRGVRQRRHPGRARRAAAPDPEAAGRAACGRRAPAGDERGQQALDPATRADPLRQRDHGHASAARRGRRGQDGRGHVDRERQRDAGPRRARAADRAEPRPARLRARQAAAQYGRDHGHALRSARPGAERRQGGPDRQHVVHRADPRAVRGGDLPRCRRAGARRCARSGGHSSSSGCSCSPSGGSPAATPWTPWRLRRTATRRTTRG